MNIWFKLCMIYRMHSEFSSRATFFNNFLWSTIVILFEVLNELSSQLFELLIISSFVLPCVDRHQNTRFNSFNFLRDLEVEAWHSLIFSLCEFTVVDGINDSSSYLKTHSFSNSVFTTTPASVNEPDVSSMLGCLFSQHLSISVRMKRKESFSEAS